MYKKTKIYSFKDALKQVTLAGAGCWQVPVCRRGK